MCKCPHYPSFVLVKLIMILNDFSLFEDNLNLSNKANECDIINGKCERRKPSFS